MMSGFPQKILFSELDEHHVLGVSVTSRDDHDRQIENQWV
jgi:hypothetical protein